MSQLYHPRFIVREISRDDRVFDTLGAAVDHAGALAQASERPVCYVVMQVDSVMSAERAEPAAVDTPGLTVGEAIERLALAADPVYAAAKVIAAAELDKTAGLDEPPAAGEVVG